MVGSVENRELTAALDEGLEGVRNGFERKIKQMDEKIEQLEDGQYDNMVASSSNESSIEAWRSEINRIDDYLLRDEAFQEHTMRVREAERNKLQSRLSSDDDTVHGTDGNEDVQNLEDEGSRGGGCCVRGCSVRPNQKCESGFGIMCAAHCRELTSPGVCSCHPARD